MPQIGLNTWLYGSFPAWTPSYTLENAIEHVSDVGYDSIEIGAASPHAWPPYMEGQRREAIADKLAETSLSVSSICPALGGGPGPNPASPLEAERDAAREHYRGCIEIADAFGADVVIWVGGWRLADQSYEDAWSNMRSVLESVLPEAERRNKTVAVEATPADSNLIDTPSDQLRLLREADSDSVGLMFDTFHSYAIGKSPTEYVAQIADDLVHIHLADTDRLPPGEGDLSFRPMLDRLAESGYDGHYTLEIFGNHLDPDEAAWNGRRNVEAMVEAI